MSHTTKDAQGATDATDRVFKALADPSRREILDIVKATPGITVNELTRSFDFTRYAVMKHLKVLEEAEIVVPRRNGRTKELYLNAIPIQTIYDRWISKYSARWAAQLTTLKYELEKEPQMEKTSLQQLYVMYIRTSPEKLWDAITNPEMTSQYFHNTRVTSDFQKGSTIEYLLDEPDGSVRAALAGTVVEVEPQKKLVHTFRFPRNDDPESLVCYELEAQGEVTRLTVTHDFDSETETYKGTAGGWPHIFSAMKTLLETGEPLPGKM